VNQPGQDAAENADRHEQRDQHCGDHDQVWQQRHFDNELQPIKDRAIGAADLIDDIDLVAPGRGRRVAHGPPFIILPVCYQLGGAVKPSGEQATVDFAR
jgi:hypothetical protein